MTSERKNEIWEYLPNDIRRKLQRDYIKACEAQEFDPHNDRIYAHRMFMQKYFGKDNMEECKELNDYNLTAQAEQKPKEPRFKVGDLVTIIADCPEKGMFGEVRGYNANTHHYNVAAYTFAESELEPYTPVSKDASKDADLDTSLEASDHIPNPTKKVDYTAYRLDLAKELAVAAMSTPNTPFSTIAINAVAIANEIVKRLKETEE